MKSGYLNMIPVLSDKFINLKTLKNTMKKFTTFLAAATFVVALSSCGSKPAETTEAPATEAVATETPAADAAATVDTAAAAVVDTAAAKM
jgi:hypothetical protein